MPIEASETLARIDHLIGLGEKVTANGQQETEGIKIFCTGAKRAIEDIYGEGHHLPAGLGANGCNQSVAKEGLAILKEARKIVAYSREFSS